MTIGPAIYPKDSVKQLLSHRILSGRSSTHRILSGRSSTHRILSGRSSTHRIMSEKNVVMSESSPVGMERNCNK